MMRNKIIIDAVLALTLLVPLIITSCTTNITGGTTGTTKTSTPPVTSTILTTTPPITSDTTEAAPISETTNPPAAEQVIKNITVDQAYKLIQDNTNNPLFVIIDVRTPDEFSGGHIEKAINIDYKSADFLQEITKLARDRVYLIYCRTGVRSSGARDIMKEQGFLNIYNMDVNSTDDPGNNKGGINDWIAAGYPVVK